MVFLDHNATTPLHPDALETMLPWLQQRYGNPSSRHSMGRDARAAIEQAREQIAALVNAQPKQVIFTSGGTEANNLALKGVLARRQGALWLSAIEHAAVLEPADALARQGHTVKRLPVSGQGQLLVEAMPDNRPESLALVSVMWANNETGAVQPVAEVAQWCREHGVPLHTDAVQALGKLPVDFAASGASLMSLSAHKIYGPKGAGALILDPALDIWPQCHGGGQERALRGGTENVAAIVGFGAAAELARLDLARLRRQLEQQRQCLERGLREHLPDVVIFSDQVERIPNTVFFSIPGLEAETLIMALDRDGFAVSSGSACGSSHDEPSPVLRAMGVDRELAQAAVRVSLGRDSSSQDLETFLHSLCTQVKALRGMAAATAW